MIPFLPSLLVAVCCPLPGNTFHVGSTQPFPTIDQALLYTAPGDLILVDPGLYPAFTVTSGVTIAPSTAQGYSVSLGAGAPAITIAGAASTVEIDGASISLTLSSAPAIHAIGCAGDVRLENVAVDKTSHQGNVPFRAAIEFDACATAILENVSVTSAFPRGGFTSLPAGNNDGLSATRFADTQFVLRDCTLVGYDAPSGGSYGGDAVRVLNSGALVPASAWMLANTLTTLVGGNASGSTGIGGNCVHQIGSLPLPGFQPEICGSHRFTPGSGGLRSGGVFAINDDGGVIPNVGVRMLPACLIDFTGFLSAPTVVAPGNSIPAALSDVNGGVFCGLFMSLGSRYAHSTPGLYGRLLLDPSSTVSVGYGNTPASFSIPVPANPSLAGMQLTLQGILFVSGTAATSLPVMVSVR